MRRCLSILFAILATITIARGADLAKHMPDRSPVLDGYNDIDSVRLAIDARGAAGIEGIWRLAGSQTLVTIEPATHPELSGAGFDALQIVIISSPRKSMRPGTVLGYAVPTARAGYWEAEIYTSKVRSLLQSHRRFTLHATDDDTHLSMTPVKSALRFNLRHSLHFLFRGSVSVGNRTHEEGFDGFIKEYPPVDGHPSRPIYL